MGTSFLDLGMCKFKHIPRGKRDKCRERVGYDLLDFGYMQI